MEALTRILAKSPGSALLVLSVLLMALACIVAFQGARLRAMRNRFRELLTGSRGENLERILIDQLRERAAMEQHVETLERRVRTLEAKVERSKRHVGVVRYDAYGEATGMQSFALAVTDDHGDGAVVTSLLGRADCRVYCKALVGGRSERPLSVEEQAAIDAARTGGTGALVG